MEQEEKLSLDFGNEEVYEVWLEVATYPADKNIKVCVFTEKEDEIWKLFELTTDMGIPLEKNQTFLLPGYDRRVSQKKRAWTVKRRNLLFWLYGISTV